MTIHFITAEVDLQEDPLALQQEIEAKLSEQGEPLRWSVTEINKQEEKVTVEAVVTTETAILEPSMLETATKEVKA